MVQCPLILVTAVHMENRCCPAFEDSLENMKIIPTLTISGHLREDSKRLMSGFLGESCLWGYL